MLGADSPPAARHQFPRPSSSSPRSRMKDGMPAAEVAAGQPPPKVPLRMAGAAGTAAAGWSAGQQPSLSAAPLARDGQAVAQHAVGGASPSGFRPGAPASMSNGCEPASPRGASTMRVGRASAVAHSSYQSGMPPALPRRSAPAATSSSSAGSAAPGSDAAAAASAAGAGPHPLIGAPPAQQVESGKWASGWHIPAAGQRGQCTPLPPGCQQEPQRGTDDQREDAQVAADEGVQAAVGGQHVEPIDAVGEGSISRQFSPEQLDPVERIDYASLSFLEHLGSGEFGQVFRGSHKGREVAIKQLFWDASIKPEVVINDLTREIESFRHLRHKRLVSFIGACLEIPNLCLVTEYMPGGSLHHLLHVRKLRLPLLHCINMCLQLADGVLYLHSQVPCVVHRDLKSLNVVLDMNLNLKLCDFGLTESMDRTHITKKNNGGSPRYMAPELFDSKSKITEKVDIWSMGCIFTEIFGGPLPYEGINTLADLTREMLVHKRMPAIPSHIPELGQNVIRSCYNFDHRLRPSSKMVFDQLKDVKKRLRMQGVI
eukprot:gnl/TRDRNA2_/TRDRNA2_168324_c0_seq2.p1 gnl/TRDRNA2_/TRDRNA2_168324_c0~~gnl/TRDRNA2_/TRDRNA2_168324_c0_seq2.p1  ORF type:complete len:560 (-),score=103.62 gnl/TRDRNA2_/TRDRNA2_168324_c0_seq2:135-1760(-)